MISHRATGDPYNDQRCDSDHIATLNPVGLPEDSDTACSGAVLVPY